MCRPTLRSGRARRCFVCQGDIIVWLRKYVKISCSLCEQMCARKHARKSQTEIRSRFTSLSGRDAIDDAALIAGVEVAAGSAECDHGCREPRQERCRLTAARRHRHDNGAFAEAARRARRRACPSGSRAPWGRRGPETGRAAGCRSHGTRGRGTGGEAGVRAALDREEVVGRPVRAEVVLVEIGDERSAWPGRKSGCHGWRIPLAMTLVEPVTGSTETNEALEFGVGGRR